MHMSNFIRLIEFDNLANFCVVVSLLCYEIKDKYQQYFIFNWKVRIPSYYWKKVRLP